MYTRATLCFCATPDQSVVGRKIPSPAGTRSGLKYGVLAASRAGMSASMSTTDSTLHLPTAAYTDFLQSTAIDREQQEEEEEREDVQRRLDYTAADASYREQSLSHLWGVCVSGGTYCNECSNSVI